MVDFAAHTRRILSRLGEDATWTPSGGTATPVRGVFSSPFVNADLGGVQVGGDRPRFSVMSADMASVARGDALAVHGGSFLVASIERDAGCGETVLNLEVA